MAEIAQMGNAKLEGKNGEQGEHLEQHLGGSLHRRERKRCSELPQQEWGAGGTLGTALVRRFAPKRRQRVL